jgi:hypothetical protein
MKTDKSGMLLGYPLHDSELISISYQDSSARLIFIGREGRVSVKLNGITHSGFRDFKFNAILSEIFAWKVCEVPSEIINVQDGAWRTLLSDLSGEDILRSAVSAICKSHSNALLVQFNYSYGGSFAVICTEMSVTQ